MLMDILMEALMSMDDESLDYVLESCDAEELEIIDSAIETISSDGKHHQTIPGTVNHAKKANEMMPRIDTKINRLRAVVNRNTSVSSEHPFSYQDSYFEHDKRNTSKRRLAKYERIKEKLDPNCYGNGEAQVVRDRGIGFTPQGTKDIAEANTAMKADRFADTMPRYEAKKK